MDPERSGAEGSPIPQQPASVPAETDAGPSGPSTLTGSAAPAPRLALPVTSAVPSGGGLPSLPTSVNGRYESLTLLGRGGMGAVYRARDLRLEREVALKLLFDDEDGERLLREARAQARVEHEHACKIYEVGVDGSTGYIAMQYIDGERLDRAAARMTLEQKVRVMRQVCLALHEAHRLGIVHRDVKPGNILVECGEDGAFHSYLTDFGIAREVGAQGRTATGVIAGTPAFMAPEQARGEVRALDRRTDVYGLGATAYRVLAGRMPFEAPKTWTLIQRILTEDAPPIRRVAPEIPVDLEAIVAKCLEKDPGRRYASARALADDLQRFLDGDPVEARRLSVGYVLLRKARRHRVRLALAGAALVAAMVVGALWLRDRRLGTQRAQLAQDLGQDGKQMEDFLIRAYELPLHDVEREKDEIRARLRSIEERMAAAGPMGTGPANYARGRGYLALHEPERARDYLIAASEAGYDSPDLHYAMGLALGELYDQALVQAKRIDNPKRQKARVDALAAQYAVPASEHLRAALEAPLEAPAYVAGLFDLRAGWPEGALEKARAAFAKAPWLYEAKRLEGDAHFAIGSRFGADAAFDYDRMMIDYRAAAEAYRSAAEIARSDPEVHEAECRLWAQIMNASTAHPETLQSSYEQATAACGRALSSSSRSASPRIEQAFVEASYAWLIVTGGAQADPELVIDASIQHAKEAARLAPGEAMAPYVVGLSLGARATHLNNRGIDSSVAIDGAIAAYEEALRIDPAFLWALNDLASTFLQRAGIELFHGLDPTVSIDTGLERSSRASAIDPGFLNARHDQADAYLLQAQYLVDTGRDPARALDHARTAIDAGRALGPDWPPAQYLSAYACWIEASYAVAMGADPTAALVRGEAIAGEEARQFPASPDANEVLGKLAMIRALRLFEQGQDPGPALRTARASFQRAVAARAWDVGFNVWRARVEALSLRWAAREREVDVELITAATKPLLALLSTPRATPGADPRLAQVLAELHEIRASSLVDRGKPADEDIAAGLANAEAALTLNPRMGPALVAKGGLLLARARGARDSRTRREDEQAAEEALSAARRENPLLEHRAGIALYAASDILHE